MALNTINQTKSNIPLDLDLSSYHHEGNICFCLQKWNVASFEGNNLVAFYCVSTSNIWPDKRDGLWWEGLYKEGTTVYSTPMLYLPPFEPNYNLVIIEGEIYIQTTWYLEIWIIFWRKAKGEWKRSCIMKVYWIYLSVSYTETRGSVGWACVAQLSFCFEEA